jgi:hypothetical protein
MTNTSAVTALLAAPIHRAYWFYAKVEIARSNVSRGEKFKKLLICATSALVCSQMEGSIPSMLARRSAKIAANIAKLPELLRKS